MAVIQNQWLLWLRGFKHIKLTFILSSDKIHNEKVMTAPVRHADNNVRPAACLSVMLHQRRRKCAGRRIVLRAYRVVTDSSVKSAHAAPSAHGGNVFSLVLSSLLCFSPLSLTLALFFSHRPDANLSAGEPAVRKEREGSGVKLWCGEAGSYSNKEVCVL